MKTEDVSLPPIVPHRLPTWVGKPRHRWLPRLGGVAWLPTRALWKTAATVFREYRRPVLVTVKAPCTGFGYRFDTDSWDEREPSHGWYRWDGSDGDTGASPEEIIRIAAASGHAEVIFYVPTPRYLVENPAADKAKNGYLWQTPEFYGAMVQYLFGQADAEAKRQNLPERLDFFAQPKGFNWANLRAQRGRQEPYPVVAVILGQEPYFIEGWEDDGAAWGAYAERLRLEIRGRGVSVPLGFHVRDSGPPSAAHRTWFKPLVEKLTYSDFSFIDLHHYYQFDTETEAFKRVYPVSIAAGGFQNWWLEKADWISDYSRFLWIVEDTRNAIRGFGLGDPSRIKLGFGEHGLSITSNFKHNDMSAALSWAAWLSEGMLQNVEWDAAWVLAEQGWSHAQIQIRDGQVTRTPAFYVYQMAQEFYGYDLLGSSLPVELARVTRTDGTTNEYPLGIVRVFQDPRDHRLHLFVVNMSDTKEATVPGFDEWQVREWKQLRASRYDEMNPLGQPWHPESVKTQKLGVPRKGAQLIVAPISVNHIVLE